MDIITQTITAWIVKHFDIDTQEINQGWCYQWAWHFYKQVGGQLCTVDAYGGHAFVLLNGLYYDSDSPRGVEDWCKFQSFKKCTPNPNKLQIMTEKEFKEHWNLWGNSGCIHESLIDTPVAELAY